MSERPKHRQRSFDREALNIAPPLDLTAVDAVLSAHGRAPSERAWDDLGPARQRRDLEWVREVVEHCDHISRYVSLGREVFDDPQEAMVRDAVEMRMVKIRHAVKSLSPAFRHECGIQELDALVGMSDRIAHDYMRIDYSIVWNAATERLPHLRAAMQRIITAGHPRHLS